MKEFFFFPEVIIKFMAQIYYVSGNRILIMISLLLVDILYNLVLKNSLQIESLS